MKLFRVSPWDIFRSRPWFRLMSILGAGSLDLLGLGWTIYCFTLPQKFLICSTLCWEIMPRVGWAIFVGMELFVLAWCDVTFCKFPMLAGLREPCTAGFRRFCTTLTLISSCEPKEVVIFWTVLCTCSFYFIACFMFFILGELIMKTF